jgi:peptidoglycan/xylan/chitin deacetylase (PgdA/CDA1 family)
MSIRHAVKNQFYFVASRLGKRLHGKASNRPVNRLMIFLMHAINHASSEMAVSPERFQEQMRSLLDSGYRPSPLDEVLEVLSGRKETPPAFAVTFDDGYESVVTQALPILESLSIPATVFLTTGFLDRKVSPPWRSSDASLLSEYGTQSQHFQPMTWEQARQLARHSLIRIGSHSVSHPLLGSISEDSVRDELVQSRLILADRLGIKPDLFAYPFGVRRYGAYSETTEKLLSEAGYRCSLTSEISRAKVGNGPWRIPRMSLTEADSGADAVAKAAGGYDWVGTAQRFYHSVFPNPHKGSN